MTYVNGNGVPGVTVQSCLDEIALFGHRLHPMRKEALLDLIFRREVGDPPLVLASSNLHGMYMLEQVAEYRALHARPETRVIVDGMPLIWLLKLFGHPVSRSNRTTWMDWFEDALERAASEGRSVYVLGHDPAVLDAGLRKARLRWPGFTIVGRDGYFDLDNPSVCVAVVDSINAHRPDILFVGMGMPRQEIFIARYGSQIQVPVIGLGGAAFAYFAGGQTPPPRWMGRVGLEWAYRLFKDPRRLAGRYLVEPFFLSIALLRRWLRGRAREAQ